MNAPVIANYCDKTFNDTLIANCYTKTQTYSNTEIDTQVDAKHNLITPSTNLTWRSLTAQTHVITHFLRTTNIEFSDVANSGATALSLKSGASTIMTMSPTAGIKHFTYTDFNNNYLYNISDIVVINNIRGGTGVFSAARGS